VKDYSTGIVEVPQRGIGLCILYLMHHLSQESGVGECLDMGDVRATGVELQEIPQLIIIYGI